MSNIFGQGHEKHYLYSIYYYIYVSIKHVVMTHS